MIKFIVILLIIISILELILTMVDSNNKHKHVTTLFRFLAKPLVLPRISNELR